MNDIDLLIKALENVADRGQTTIQVAGALRLFASELRKLDVERSALERSTLDAVRDAVV